jgi:hypothetical protein
MKKLALMAMAATWMLTFTITAVMAQEKAKAAPEKMKAGQAEVKVLLENDRVKVQEIRSKPGNKSEMKERPDRVVYTIKGGEFKVTYSDGKTVNEKLKAGEATFAKKEKSARENVGKTEAHWIGIQLK